jgi:transposase
MPASTGKPGSLRTTRTAGRGSWSSPAIFYKVYESAGKKAGGLVNLYCWAHIRRHFVRAGDANPQQLKYWTDAWLERIRDLYRAHDELMAAWQESTAPAPREQAAAVARLEKARATWDDAITVIDEAGKKQMAAPGLQEPAKKALATLDPGPRMGRTEGAPRVPDGIAG